MCLRSGRRGSLRQPCTTSCPASSWPSTLRSSRHWARRCAPCGAGVCCRLSSWEYGVDGTQACLARVCPCGIPRSGTTAEDYAKEHTGDKAPIEQLLVRCTGAKPPDWAALEGATEECRRRPQRSSFAVVLAFRRVAAEGPDPLRARVHRWCGCCRGCTRSACPPSSRSLRHSCASPSERESGKRARACWHSLSSNWLSAAALVVVAGSRTWKCCASPTKRRCRCVSRCGSRRGLTSKQALRICVGQPREGACPD